MTATELINNLQKLPPDTRIVVSGYEDGFNDIIELKKVRIKKDVYEHWYEGAHAESIESDSIDAVLLFGENKNAKD